MTQVIGAAVGGASALGGAPDRPHRVIPHNHREHDLKPSREMEIWRFRNNRQHYCAAATLAFKNCLFFA
ncbi:hypothetical protein [Polymorphum gilvum]|uniref:hypothetical protein n=1 Tax=Polymorphum gilvum TaxID=991904 RepID=UPI0011D21C9A|nr:hypothetical protein [Polymorphum gilvum]